MARLVQELAPGGQLAYTRRLRGGLGAKMHLLAVERADGTRFKVTLRRFVRAHPSSAPERVAREFEVLRLVERAGIPAPRPLLLDGEGRFFGVPAIVLTYLPGRGFYAATGSGIWAEDLAGALVRVHCVTPDRFDLSGLHVQLRDQIREAIQSKREELMAGGDELRQEVQAVLESEMDSIEWVKPCLVHDDYYPGNTVWYRGRLAGIIDWTDAELGDPRTDVAQCRLDLVVSHGVDVAESFLHAYERLTPRPLPDLWYFDLYRGLRALAYYERWLEGYHDAGMTHLTSEDVGARLRAFIREVLDERPWT